jgi:two-component system sensor kinase FixL
MTDDTDSIDQLFFKYADQFSSILLVLDKDGYIEHINSTMVGVLDDPPDQFIGKNWFTDCVPGHAYDKAITIFAALKQSVNKQIELHIYPILCVKQQEHVISWHSITRYNDNKQVVGIWMAGFTVKPNDLIAYEEELSSKRKILTAQAILDNAVEGIITIDPQGLIISFNHAAETLFGYNGDETIGNNIKMLMPAPYKQEHDHYLHNYRTTGHKKIIGIGREVLGLRKNGSQFPMELSVAEVKVDGERSFVGIVRDISERKQAQEQLEIREQELQQIRNRMAHMDRLNVMGEMATGIAHELNQPLTAIATYAQASSRLLDTTIKNTDDLSHSLNQINEQAQRAGEVIRRLRAMVTKQVHSRQRVNLRELILEAIELSKTDSRTQNISIEASFTDIEVIVEIDSVQIQQVILNLIRNALDAMEDANMKKNKHLIIKVEKNTEFVHIAIIDNGPGLQNIDASDIFNPFTSTKKHGMGIGLAICRSIIIAHEGNLQFNSENKTGTEFYFTLPILPILEDK